MEQSKNQKKPKVVKAERDTYRQEAAEEVFKVDKSPIRVDKGETLDILIDCQRGFTVFIPYAGFFGDHVFEAKEQPAWAPEKSTAEEKWWGVRLTRTQLDNPNPNPDPNKKEKELAYCIYSKDLDNFAVGNSPPKMILDP